MPAIGDPSNSRTEGDGRRGRVSPIEALVLAFLAVRLLAWAFLLPPWDGFDEPFHQGYVEVCAEEPGWHGYLSARLPVRLVAAMRERPLYPKYAHEFGAPEWGASEGPPLPSRANPGDRNYEMLQSPGYYVAAGFLLRALPPLSPVSELYLLRGVNALLAFMVGILTLAAARRIGFGGGSWMAVAVLAFIPGFSLSLVRVSNDALCAALLAIAVGASLEAAGGVGRRPLTAASAAGLAPWAKLYGLAAVPGLVIDALHKGERRRVVRLALLIVPSLLLGYFSRKVNGSAVSLLEILSRPNPARLAEVPWLRDAWTIAKSHLWVSGMSTLVFGNAVYILLIAGLAGCVYLTMKTVSGEEEDRSFRNFFRLAAPIAFFVPALAYFAWKNFARFREPGGAGGWYLWALALPEALLLTWGIAGRVRGLAGSLLLAAFYWMTIAGDLVLFAEVSGKLLTETGNRHVRGIAPARFADLWTAFLASRPARAAYAAIALVAVSWILGFIVLVAVRPRKRPHPDLNNTRLP